MPIYGAALMGGGSGPAFAAIGAIYPAGATCTCSYGGKTIAAKDTSGRALFLVPSAGQWLVKATNGGQEVEDTVSITTQGQVASVTLRYEIDLINDNDTTGGWSVGYNQNSTPTITTEADKITVSSESTDTYQANICTAVTENLIDLSGFTKITVDVTDVNILSAGDIRIGLVKSRNASSLVSSVKITAKKEYSLSITPGSYYVAIYVKGDIDGAEVKEASYVAVDKLVAS